MMAWKNISILQMFVCLCQYLDEFQYQNKCKNAIVKYVFMFIHTVDDIYAEMAKFIIGLGRNTLNIVTT